jgi:antibiotic biosynthesis monooxygenase (ABM) superfamily enzyme
MTSTPPARPAGTRPPTKHELALMIWLAVFPTLTVLNLALGDWLSTLSPVLRTFVLATVAVPSSSTA